MTATPAALMTASLLEVFGERDQGRRRSAMERTFAAHVTFHDPEGSLTGYEALDDKVTALYDGAPSDWAFQPTAPAAEAADLGRITWGFGPLGSQWCEGMDIGLVSDGHIVTMYTILESAT